MQSAAFTPFRPHLNSTVIKQLANRIKHDTCTIDDAALVFDQETANQTSQTSLFMNDQFRRAVIKSFLRHGAEDFMPLLKSFLKNLSVLNNPVSKNVCLAKYYQPLAANTKKRLGRAAGIGGVNYFECSLHSSW